MNSPWIVRFHPRPAARLRLFCFPYAGSGASLYRGWQALVPARVEVCGVQPPGREARFHEPAYRDLPEMVETLGAAIGPYLDLPFAFFGHSMGAWTAFELARRLEATRQDGPRWLFVSGRRGPRQPPREPELHRLADNDLIAAVMRWYGGIPAELLREREVLDLFLPTLRADIAALERYTYRDGGRLSCPVTAYGGETDPLVTRDDLEAWGRETRGNFRVQTLPGGHFYLKESTAELVRSISKTLVAAVPDAERAFISN